MTRTSASTSSGVRWVLLLLGGFVGYGYGAAAGGDSQVLYAATGGLIGVFAIDLLRFLVNVVKVVVITALAVVCIAIVIYVITLVASQ